MTNSLDPSDQANFALIWQGALDAWIEGNNPELPKIGGTQRSVLRQVTPVAFINGIAVLTTPNQWSKEQIEESLTSAITQVLELALNQTVTLSLSVKEEPAPAAEPIQPAQQERQSAPAPDAPATTAPATPTPAPVRQETEPAEPAQQHALDDDERARVLRAEQLAQEKTQEAQPSAVGGAVAPQSTKPVYSPQGQMLSGPGMPSAPDQLEAQAQGIEADTDLNKKYTFETFVIGGSNQFAHAACRAVAEAPALAYNPLFVWGESGLGKTHLLHAIGHYAQELQPNMKVLYVSSEELTNDFINSIANDTREEFKRRYRSLDMLIVDDIQFLQGKESTQEEFFHTFNALHQSEKQIVLSSDRPPHKLTTLEDRLRTRFEGGLITDVQTPDLETRMAILSKKARAEGTELPEDVMELIASRYETSIRELEGALIRVTAYCSLSKEPISLEAAEIALRDILPADDVQMTPQVIMDVVSSYYDMTIEEITGKGRTRPVAQARQVAMYLCRELTDLSLPKLGDIFGKDHSTVLHAEKRITERINEDRDLFNDVQELTHRAKTSARG